MPPVEAEAAKPKPEPEPQPPQIAPQLSAKAQAAAVRTTTDDIRVAERNLQTAYGRQLNASQSDLVEKIAGFLAQAHEAIRTGDWVRAQNLAQKAQVLSARADQILLKILNTRSAAAFPKPLLPKCS